VLKSPAKIFHHALTVETRSQSGGGRLVRHSLLQDLRCLAARVDHDGSMNPNRNRDSSGVVNPLHALVLLRYGAGPGYREARTR